MLCSTKNYSKYSKQLCVLLKLGRYFIMPYASGLLDFCIINKSIYMCIKIHRYIDLFTVSLIFYVRKKRNHELTRS